jgi:hypothetical protein
VMSFIRIKRPYAHKSRPKPFIYYNGTTGYWQVSHMPKPYNAENQPAWSAAHEFADRLNRINKSHRNSVTCRCCLSH